MWQVPKPKNFSRNKFHKISTNSSEFWKLCLGFIPNFSIFLGSNFGYFVVSKNLATLILWSLQTADEYFIFKRTTNLEQNQKQQTFYFIHRSNFQILKFLKSITIICQSMEPVPWDTRDNNTHYQRKKTIQGKTKKWAASGTRNILLLA